MPRTWSYKLVLVAFGAYAYALRPTPTRRRTPGLAARLAATQTTQTEDAAELLRQAATLRAEAAALEQELKPVTVAEGANNVLPLPRPAWKTQVWFDEDRPLRFSWRLLAGGRAEVNDRKGGDCSEPGWQLVGQDSRKLLECWFWKEGQKITLKAYATPSHVAERLLEAARAAKENLENCEAKLRAAEAREDKNPFELLANAAERMNAADLVLSARQVLREYEANAALARGPSVDLDGASWVLAERGAAAELGPDASQPARLGSFHGWHSPRG